MDMHLGINVHELMKANAIGPVYSDDYKTANDARRRLLDNRQEAGEDLFGRSLKTTLYLVAPGSYNIVLWTDRDIKRKTRLIQKAVKITPLNELLTNW